MKFLEANAAYVDMTKVYLLLIFTILTRTKKNF